MVALRQVFLLWRPAKQGNNIFVMFVNEGCDRAILDHIYPSSNEGVPRGGDTDHRWSKVELRGQPRLYNPRVRRGNIYEMIRRERVGMTQKSLARKLSLRIRKKNIPHQKQAQNDRRRGIDPRLPPKCKSWLRLLPTQCCQNLGP